MKLYLIRHGLTEGNLRHLYYGSTDLPLSPEGRTALKPLMLPGVVHYYTSGMRRTEETFECLFGPVPHEVLPGMREINFGDFEMRSYEQLKEDAAFQHWCEGDNEKNVCPNGESGFQATQRALRALAPLLTAGEDAAVVTHGGIIGGILASWFPHPDGRYHWTPAPGGGYAVTVENGQPVSCEQIG